jgi:putative transposase
MGERRAHTKRRRHTPEQVVRKRREADRLLGEGMEMPEVAMAKTLEISEQTYHRWRAQYGGMKADDVKRLKELLVGHQALENGILVLELENLALREISKGTTSRCAVRKITNTSPRYTQANHRHACSESDASVSPCPHVACARDELQQSLGMCRQLSLSDVSSRSKRHEAMRRLSVRQHWMVLTAPPVAEMAQRAAA